MTELLDAYLAGRPDRAHCSNARGPRLGAERLMPQTALFLGLLLDGFQLAPRGMGAVATPTTERDVDELAEATIMRLMSMQPVAAG